MRFLWGFCSSSARPTPFTIFEYEIGAVTICKESREFRHFLLVVAQTHVGQVGYSSHHLKGRGTDAEILIYFDSKNYSAVSKENLRISISFSSCKILSNGALSSLCGRIPKSPWMVRVTVASPN